MFFLSSRLPVESSGFTLTTHKSFWFCLILMDSVLHSIDHVPFVYISARRCAHASCFALILLRSNVKGHIIQRRSHLNLCKTRCVRTAPGTKRDVLVSPWRQRIEHVAKSNKLHQLLLLYSRLCIAKPWMLCICHCTNSIKVELGVPFYAWC